MKRLVDILYLPLKQDMKIIHIKYGFRTRKKFGQLNAGDNRNIPINEILAHNIFTDYSPTKTWD